jgi:hypothetical protein
MRATDSLGDEPIMKKPMPMMKLVMMAPMVPYCKISFLPYFFNRNELMMAVTTCSKLTIEGSMGLKEERFPSAISPA